MFFSRQLLAVLGNHESSWYIQWTGYRRKCLIMIIWLLSLARVWPAVLIRKGKCPKTEARPGRISGPATEDCAIRRSRPAGGAGDQRCDFWYIWSLGSPQFWLMPRRSRFNMIQLLTPVKATGNSWNSWPRRTAPSSRSWDAQLQSNGGCHEGLSWSNHEMKGVAPPKKKRPKPALPMELWIYHAEVDSLDVYRRCMDLRLPIFESPWKSQVEAAHMIKNIQRPSPPQKKKTSKIMILCMILCTTLGQCWSMFLVFHHLAYSEGPAPRCLSSGAGWSGGDDRTMHDERAERRAPRPLGDLKIPELLECREETKMCVETMIFFFDTEKDT